MFKQNKKYQKGGVKKLTPADIKPAQGDTKGADFINPNVHVTDGMRLQDLLVNPKHEIRERMHKNMLPVGYDIESAIDAVLFNENQVDDESRKQLKTRYDYFNKYLGYPYDEKEIHPSKYKPSIGKEGNKTYYTSQSAEESFPNNLYDYPNRFSEKGDLPRARDLNELKQQLQASTDKKRQGKHGIVTPVGQLGDATVSMGEDEKGAYLSYYDSWDINPFRGSSAKLTRNGNSFQKLLLSTIGQKEDITGGIGKPFDVYGRIYYDKKTGERIKTPEQQKAWDKMPVDPQWTTPKFQKGGVKKLTPGDIKPAGSDIPVLISPDKRDELLAAQKQAEELAKRKYIQADRTPVNYERRNQLNKQNAEAQGLTTDSQGRVSTLFNANSKGYNLLHNAGDVVGNVAETAMAIDGLPSIGESAVNGFKKLAQREARPLVDAATALSPEAKNLQDLMYAKDHFSKYRYEIPKNLEEIAKSNELTDNTIKGLVDQHNTFVRGVSTNWKELEERSPQVLRHLEDKGIDYRTDPEGAAKYMATHVPIQTNYGRAGLEKPIFDRGMDGVYTSNSLETAEGYTYGDGYVVKAKRPTDFSSPNRKDWIHNNDVNYFKENLPKLIDTPEALATEKTSLINKVQENKENFQRLQKKVDRLQKVDSNPDKLAYIKNEKLTPENFNAYPQYQKDGYYTVNDYFLNTKIPKSIRDTLGWRGGQMYKSPEEALKGISADLNSYKEKLDAASKLPMDKKAIDTYLNNPDKYFRGDLKGQILKTSYNDKKLGEDFGDYGSSALDLIPKLENDKTLLSSHNKEIMGIVKDVGSKNNPKISQLQDRYVDLMDKGENNLTPDELEELNKIESQTASLKQSSKEEVFNRSKQYLSEKFPGWENHKEDYAHYIHIGTPGSQILEPLEATRITPDIYNNRSRAHFGKYTKGLSAAATVPIIAGATAMNKKEQGGFSTLGYKKNSKDKNNPYNVIPSNRITMQDVPHPVMGISDSGEQRLMMPGEEHQFSGNQVLEIPIRQQGGYQQSKGTDLSYMPAFANSFMQAIATRVNNNRDNAYQQSNLTNPLNYLPQINNTNPYETLGVQQYQQGGEITDSEDLQDEDFLYSSDEQPEAQPAVQEAPEEVQQPVGQEEPEEQGISIDTSTPDMQDDNEPVNPETGQPVYAQAPTSMDADLVAQESGGDYKAENPHSSAVGKYQFLWNQWSPSIKAITGVADKEAFKNNPLAQENFYSWYKQSHMAPAVERLKAYNGKGLSDAQLGKLYHFKGEAGAQEWLTSGVDKTRANNTSIEHYIGKS